MSSTFERRTSVPPNKPMTFASTALLSSSSSSQPLPSTKARRIGGPSSLSSSRKPFRSSVTMIGGVLIMFVLVYFGTLFSMTSLQDNMESTTRSSSSSKDANHNNRRSLEMSNSNTRNQKRKAQQNRRRNYHNNNKNSHNNKNDNMKRNGRNNKGARLAKIVKTRRTMRRRPSFKAEQYGKDVNPHTIKPMNTTTATSTTSFTTNNKQQHDKPARIPPSSQVVLKTFLEPIDPTAWNVKPLAVRSTARAQLLKEISYPQLQSCRRLQEQWPTDEFPDADPFLPWIHDVFPTHDGKFIQFVAQNKRRCRTGTSEEEISILEHMAPQVALFQHVPVQRMPPSSNNNKSKNKDNKDIRYRLASHEEADPDGIATRFICRFKPSMRETLSVFNVDYDWASFRKGHRQTFTEEGYDNKSIHTSQLIFLCPVPDEMVDVIRSGSSVHHDWATLFVDVIPIRTPPRYGPPNRFFPPWYKNLQVKKASPHYFDPSVEWGDRHILPRIEESGRWENIPICQPSLMTYEPQLLQQSPHEQSPTAIQQQRKGLESKSKKSKSIDIINTDQGRGDKKHGLVACVWASAGYTTRGHRFAVNDGQRRLLEWIHFNQLVGFDHFYIYDNSGAFSKDVSLQPITDMFPDLVTRITWPAKVCNNNPNNVDSVGERSSQYAAEASCRLRFGPHVEWMASFDLDEYIVPVGKYTSLLPLLDKLNKEGRKIISFGSWRAWPRRDLIDKPIPISDARKCWSSDTCFDLTVPLNHTILQTYNCDRVKGKKKQTMPAEKQIYRPDYVKQHFIHYSTITELTLWNTTEWASKSDRSWRPQLAADPYSRFSDELTEATMLHTKAVARQDTAGYEYVCRKDYTGNQYCRLGNPWPPAAEEANITADSNGWKYNCYVNERIEQYWVPRLEKALRKDSNAAFKE